MSIKTSLMNLPFYNQMVLPWHYLQAVRYGVKYRWPARNLRVIGVTGTNGKTTTSFMIWKMLVEAGYKTGLLTTVGWSEDGSELHAQIQHMTTESVNILDKRMRAVADAGAEFMVIEVTSHALAQFRILGVPIEVAVFTNLTHEHLDYHKTFAKYRQAKAKLFRHAKKAVINADDGSGMWLADYVRKYSLHDMKKKGDYSSDDIILFGIEQGDLRAEEFELLSDGVKYSCCDMRLKNDYSSGDIKCDDKMTVKTRIPGKFNVYNSLAAVGVGKQLGLSDQQISQGIYALESVEGRMTRVEAGQDFTVIVDYAHTPDALEKLFASVKSDQRIIAVHGGAGRRDESTREERGEILGKNSDIVIITEDDTRDEDLTEIMQSFAEGAKKVGKVLDQDLFMVVDRREAIEKAVAEAKSGDMVLILGKGHEKTILRPDGVVPFEDIKVARESLEKLK